MQAISTVPSTCAPRLAQGDPHTQNALKRNHVNILDGQGPVLVYAHGFGCSQGVWKEITPAFDGRCRQVLFDYVGCGGSDLAAFDVARYRHLQGYATDLIEVCEAADVHSDAILVAHSVSCSIGMLAAIRRPQLFRHIVMIGPNPCFLNDPQYTGGFELEDLEGLLDLMDRNFMGWAEFLSPVVGGVHEPTERNLHRSFCSTDPLTARTFAEATFFADNRYDVRQVPVPCLILQHRQDALAPLCVGEYLNRHLPMSELCVMDVVGHCAHMSHPDLVAAYIRSLLPF